MFCRLVASPRRFGPLVAALLTAASPGQVARAGAADTAPAAKVSERKGRAVRSKARRARPRKAVVPGQPAIDRKTRVHRRRSLARRRARARARRAAELRRAEQPVALTSVAPIGAGEDDIGLGPGSTVQLRDPPAGDVEPDRAGAAPKPDRIASLGSMAATADASFGKAAASDEAFSFGGEAEAKVEARGGAPSPISAGGSLRSVAAGWVEDDPTRPSRLAQARTSADLWLRRRTDALTLHAAGHAEYDLAYQVDRGSHDRESLDTYEYVVEPREIYAAASWRGVDLTAGRFIAAWGEGLLLTPLDIVNPRDQREIGLVEPDELRLPTLGTRVAVSGSVHELELIVMHEADFGRRPPPGGEYSSLPVLFPILDARPARWDHAQDRFSLDTQQIFGRWSFRAHQVDVGLYAARALDQQGIVLVPPIDPASQDPIELTIDHRPTTTFGVAGALLAGDFVFKLEAAVQPFRFLNTYDPATGAVGAERFSAVTAMAGLNYWKAPWRATVEISKMELQRAAIDVSGGMEPIVVAPTDTIIASRVQYDPDVGRFQATAAAVAIGDAGHLAWLARIEAGYELRTALLLTVGYATYHPNDEFNLLAGLDTIDRLYARLRWDFSWN